MSYPDSAPSGAGDLVGGRLEVAGAGNLVWGARRSGVRRTKGAIAALYQHPSDTSVVICLDEMGLEFAKSFHGQQAIAVNLRPAQRK
jgi:hypothetical protein